MARSLEIGGSLQRGRNTDAASDRRAGSSANSVRTAPSVQHILGNSPFRRLEISEVAPVHAGEHRRDDRPRSRIDDADVVAEQRRPVTGLVSDAGAKADPLRKPRVVELLAKNTKHLLRRRLARQLALLQLLEQ